MSLKETCVQMTRATLKRGSLSQVPSFMNVMNLPPSWYSLHPTFCTAATLEPIFTGWWWTAGVCILSLWENWASPSNETQGSQDTRLGMKIMDALDANVKVIERKVPFLFYEKSTQHLAARWLQRIQERVWTRISKKACLLRILFRVVRREQGHIFHQSLWWEIENLWGGWSHRALWAIWLPSLECDNIFNVSTSCLLLHKSPGN